MKSVIIAFIVIAMVVGGVAYFSLKKMHQEEKTLQLELPQVKDA